MELVGAKSFVKTINIPSIALNKVTVATNCVLSEDEITLFNASIKAVCEYIQKCDISLEDSFNVIFTEDGSLAFEENSEGALGYQFQLATYNMKRLRDLNDYEMMVFTFIEELSHYFFRICDEKTVKYRVEEIISIFYPEFDLNELRKKYILNGFNE